MAAFDDAPHPLGSAAIPECLPLEVFEWLGLQRTLAERCIHYRATGRCMTELVSKLRILSVGNLDNCLSEFLIR